MSLLDFSKKKELEEIKLLKEQLEEFRPILNIQEKVKTIEDQLNNLIKEKELRIDVLKNQIKKHEDIVDLEEKIAANEREYSATIKTKKSEIRILDDEYASMRQKYTDSRELYLKLKQELKIYQDKIDLTEFGIYEPVYDFEKSEDYRAEQAVIIQRQKAMVSNENAATCSVNWTIDGSEAKGKSSTKRLIKLVLRAFNGECDSFIAKVKWNNVSQMRERIRKAYESINKLSEGNAITISKGYLDLKINELNLEYEYQAKKQEEKEKMRAIQEELREEEKAKREFEKAQRDAEKEEAIFQKALDKIKKDMGYADPEMQEKMQQQINLLETELEEARLKKERALSMAQQTKRGHVYIISNIGSFGENVYKIGMTRRLEPTDRVKELGDASVPFQFDIHAMIYSDEARTLEYELHKAFSDKKVNMLNYRREFFRVSLQEIEAKIKQLGFEAEFTILPEAMEYRETISIIEKTENEIELQSIQELIENDFPLEI